MIIFIIIMKLFLLKDRKLKYILYCSVKLCILTVYVCVQYIVFIIIIIIIIIIVIIIEAQNEVFDVIFASINSC